MRTILTISRDQMLLETRAAVLRKTNAEVVTATANEAKKILESRQFDVVVLCHSLSPEETSEIASLAHQQAIAVPVITVIPNAEPVSERRLLESDSTASCDPRTLIEKVAGILSVSPSGSN